MKKIKLPKNIQQFKRWIHKKIPEKDAFEKRILLDSKSERDLFDELRYLKHMPETQYPVKGYFLDFAYPKLKIGIEIDGGHWHRTEAQIQSDIRRQREIEKEGWSIFRIDEPTVRKNPEMVATDLVKQIFGEKISPRIEENNKRYKTYQRILDEGDKQYAEAQLNGNVEWYRFKTEEDEKENS